MVIAGVVKSVGVRNPIPWIRKFKSTYVETTEQEEFVNNLPAVIDSKIAEKYPTLASVISLETLLLSQMHHHASKAHSAKLIPATMDDLKLTNEQIHDYTAAFELYCGESGAEEISKESLSKVLKQLGCEIPAEKFGDGHISKFSFLLAMSHSID